MRRATFGFLLALFGTIVAPGFASADEAVAWAALRQGGHVALMRHADAPGGSGDPPGFRLDDCATQRNLSARGRAEAKAVGGRLRAEGITIARRLSSPWCRCLETARLMDIGPIEVASTFGNVVVLSDQRDALTAGARKVVDAWKGPGTLLVVTHGANIGALTGTYPAAGEVVVVAPSAGAPMGAIGRIPAPAISP